MTGTVLDNRDYLERFCFRVQGRRQTKECTITIQNSSPSLAEVWFTHRQHHLQWGACQKWNTSSPTPDLLNQNLNLDKILG